MRALDRRAPIAMSATALAVIVSTAILSGRLTPRAQTPATPFTPPVSAASFAPEAFSGTWIYNAADSLDAGTGKPESLSRRPIRGGGASMPNRPDGGALRGGGGSSGRPPSGFGGSGGSSGSSGSGDGTSKGSDRPISGSGGGGRVRGTGGSGLPGASEAAMMEMRDLQRDLLEVAERWTITATRDHVNFTDDLDREQTFRIDGRKQEHHLSAVTFQAKVSWDGPRLLKDITGRGTFKMTETFMLNADGTRLFQIVRIGDPQPGVRPVGANRVYDRGR